MRKFTYGATIEIPIEITEEEFEKCKLQFGIGELEKSPRTIDFVYREMAYARGRAVLQNALSYGALVDTYVHIAM